MPEATVIILDNSEWMRNGDYTPNRMQAQIEAAHLLCEAKEQQNPENSCAVITSGGHGPKVLLTLTTDIGKVLSATYNLEPEGNCDLAAALQVAQLTLNHRMNRGHSQRVVAFVGSPLRNSVEELRKVATQLRQANVAVDLISFGEIEPNAPALNALFATVNKGDTSHMLTVEPGPQLLTDRLVMSSIIQGGDTGAAAVASAIGSSVGGGGSGSIGGDIGFNPELDPELATVLRESMQEYQRTQPTAAPVSQQQQQSQGVPNTPASDVAMNEDEELRRALEMSVLVATQPTTTTQSQQQQQQQPTSATLLPTSAPVPTVSPMELTEDQQMEMALQLSMQEPKNPHDQQQQQQPSETISNTSPSAAVGAKTPKEEKNRPETNFQEALGDQQFLSDLLSSLPGVNPSDTRIQDVIASIRGGDKEKEKEKDQQQQQQQQQQKKKDEEEKKDDTKQ